MSCKPDTSTTPSSSASSWSTDTASACVAGSGSRSTSAVYNGLPLIAQLSTSSSASAAHLPRPSRTRADRRHLVPPEQGDVPHRGQWTAGSASRSRTGLASRMNRRSSASWSPCPGRRPARWLERCRSCGEPGARQLAYPEADHLRALVAQEGRPGPHGCTWPDPEAEQAARSSNEAARRRDR